MAVDPIRDRIRIIHIVFAQEPGASSLLALVCSVGKIPDSLVITSRYWEPSTVATRLHGNACRAVRRDGAGQPTLHTVDDAGDLSSHSLDGFPECDASASRPTSCNVALRICDGYFRMVCALESDFPSHSGSGALAGRARSGSAAPDRVYYRKAATNRTAIVASISGTWNFRHRPARFGMAGGHLRTSRRCASGSHSFPRTVARTPSRQSGRYNAHGGGSHLLVSPVGLVVGSPAGGGARTRLRRRSLGIGQRSPCLCREYFEDMRILCGISAGLRVRGYGCRSEETDCTHHDRACCAQARSQ